MEKLYHISFCKIYGKMMLWTATLFFSCFCAKSQVGHKGIKDFDSVVIHVRGNALVYHLDVEESYSSIANIDAKKPVIYISEGTVVVGEFNVQKIHSKVEKPLSEKKKKTSHPKKETFSKFAKRAKLNTRFYFTCNQESKHFFIGGIQKQWVTLQVRNQPDDVGILPEHSLKSVSFLNCRNEKNIFVINKIASLYFTVKQLRGPPFLMHV